MSKSKSVLPAKAAGTGITRFNALRHGVLSRYTVLPWENSDEYRAVVEALVAEHVPQGPTEEHLVEEIAGILWRKRRLRMAEAAAHRRGLEDALEPHRETAKAALIHLNTTVQSESAVDAVRATAADTNEDMADMEADEAMTRRALDLLGSRRNDAYEASLAVLREDTKDWWADVLGRDPDEIEEGEEPATADVEGHPRPGPAFGRSGRVISQTIPNGCPQGRQRLRVCMNDSDPLVVACIMPDANRRRSVPTRELAIPRAGRPRTVLKLLDDSNAPMNGLQGGEARLTRFLA
jgi:hypothetical protein